MRTSFVLSILVVLGIVYFVVPARSQPAATPHVMLLPSEMKWGDGPPGLPTGAKMSVLYGDPGKPGMFIVRLRFPVGYRIGAHWHPTDENISIVSGSFQMGMGDKLDATMAKAYPPGSFLTMPAKTNHYAIAKEETVVELTAMGPFAITYVDPKDDPRKAHTR